MDHRSIRGEIMAIKLVAFDWNGTIISDTSLAADAESTTRVKFGLSAISKASFQDQFDIPVSKYWIRSGFSAEEFEKKHKDIHNTFLQHFLPHEKMRRSRAGTRDLLIFLESASIRRIIFSNHIVPYIHEQLNRLKLDKYFDAVLARPSRNDSSHMLNQGKAAKLHDFVKNLNIAASEVMTVGDTIEEIEIAKKLGYASVAITGGYQSTRRLKAAKPDYLINNLSDLKEIISNGRTTQTN